MRRSLCFGVLIWSFVAQASYPACPPEILRSLTEPYSLIFGSLGQAYASPKGPALPRSVAVTSLAPLMDGLNAVLPGTSQIFPARAEQIREALRALGGLMDMAVVPYPDFIESTLHAHETLTGLPLDLGYSIAPIEGIEAFNFESRLLLASRGIFPLDPHNRDQGLSRLFTEMVNRHSLEERKAMILVLYYATIERTPRIDWNLTKVKQELKLAMFPFFASLFAKSETAPRGFRDGSATEEKMRLAAWQLSQLLD